MSGPTDAPSTRSSRGASKWSYKPIRLPAQSYQRLVPWLLHGQKIEEVYIDSLNKLYRKTRTFDAYLDDRAELNTTRKAWAEIRESVDRETQTRQAFLNALISDVIGPLVSLKESQERTRKRVKEDIKESAGAHNDYADNTLPKLKRAYLRKCQEVEDHRAASAVSPVAGQAPVYGDNAPMNNSRSNPNLPSRPTVTAPQPLRPMERRPSGSAPNRNRSPPTSTSFSDLAHQGKRQLNQLMTFLDKGASVKDGVGGRSADASLRMVRSKREADEADKEYRKGIYWLETLRLRRVKILQAGYNSLERFYLEAGETVQKIMISYTDNLMHTHLATHARSVVESVSPEDDKMTLAAQIPRLLASATPKPILYYNYHVGECQDLIFGVSMSDYATTRGLGEGDIPKIVRLCIDEVDKRGLSVEGIYRVSGRHAVVQELQHKLERNEHDFAFNSMTDDVHAVSSLLKLYLRQLPEPIFKFPQQDRIQHTEEIDEHTSNNFVLLRSKIRRLPSVHRASLKALVEHLARVAAHSEKNKMDAKNLAIIFGTVVFGEDEIPQGGDLMSIQTSNDTLMEDIILHAHMLFDDHLPPSSPPLPAAPLGEPTPVYSLGSSHTQFANISGSSLATPVEGAPSHPLRTPISPVSHAEPDFTPELPPRPANSIHPGARREGAMSPPRRPVSLLPQIRPQSMRPEDFAEEAMNYGLQSDCVDLRDRFYLRKPGDCQLKTHPPSATVVDESTLNTGVIV
ncbi:hypothetical protein OF83DRAFT_1171488 [Amylostereum chailletii]|nr:hypothetical protein OF83DRAFT_1171488 [Amylostereum chailletii]